MMYNLKIPLLILCLVMSRYSKAQEQKILSLDEAINLGIAHSKQLQTDNIQVRIAESKVLQGIQSQVAQVSLNLSYRSEERRVGKEC